MAEKARRERTVVPYLRAVWKHWKLLALDVVLGVLGLVDSISRFRTTSELVRRTPSRLVLHHSILPGWVWFAAFGVVLVTVQFRAWRDIYRPPLTPEHTAALRQIAAHAGQSLGGISLMGAPKKVVYRTDASHNEYVKRMFRAHFPELAVLLDRWDALDEEERAAEAELGVWLQNEVSELFPFSGNGDWYTPTIVKLTIEHVTRSLNLPAVPEPAVGWSAGVILWGQTIVRDIGAGYDHGSPIPPAVEVLMDELRSWVMSLSDAPRRSAVIALRAQRRDLREQIWSALRPLAETELWGRCDACRPGRRSAEYQAATGG